MGPRNFISVAVSCLYGKWYPILDPNSLISRPYPRLNYCLTAQKTLPFTAAHTYIPYIWEYPPGGTTYVYPGLTNEVFNISCIRVFNCHFLNAIVQFWSINSHTKHVRQENILLILYVMLFNKEKENFCLTVHYRTYESEVFFLLFPSCFTKSSDLVNLSLQYP